MDLFEDNLSALAERSPCVARRVAALGDEAGEFTLACAADGSAIVERRGVPLDSRRAPVEAARRQAQTVAAGSVVVAGLGAGYLVEALLAAGRRVTAIIEGSPEALAAAMRARDLRAVLSRVPVLLEEARDPVTLICLKAKGAVLVPQAGTVAGDPVLQALVRVWPDVMAPTRAPRVLVVGPIAGGSLETARSTALAVEEVGAECRFVDFSAFAGGWHALTGMGLHTQQAGHLQNRYAEMLGEVVIEQAAAWRPDLVLALAQAPLSVPHLHQLRRSGVATAFWFVENSRVLTYWREVAPAYDVFFAIQPAFLEALREAGSPKAVYVPTACDASRHVPVALTPEEESRFGAPVSFAGAPYLNRRYVLPAVSNLGLRVWGEGWEKTELSAQAAEGGRRFDLAEMVRIFAASKVNLNIHSATHVNALDPDADYVNPRTFELAACGAFQLVDDRQPLRDLFTEAEVVAFRSVAEMRDQVRYYLERPEERAAVAARARLRALAEHTFQHRVRVMLREAVPAPMAAAALLGVRRETLDEALARFAGEPRVTREEAMLLVLKEARRT